MNSYELAKKLMKYPTAIGRIAIVLINNVYCIPTYVVWMTMLIPLKHLHPDAYYKIAGLFYHWLLAVVSMWSYSAGYDIVETGDDISECRDRQTLVIANHQSTADVPLLMANFNAKDHILPNIMWIMDRLFKYTNFGIVSIIHQDFFIAAGKTSRDESLESLKHHLSNSYLPRKRKWMVLFPEGGFLRKRRDVSNRFAQKKNLPMLHYVTLPRIGAFKAIIDCMCIKTHIPSILNKNSISIDQRTLHVTQLSIGNGNVLHKNHICSNNSNDNNTETPTKEKNSFLDYILDITIAYPNSEPLDLPTILHGLRESCQTHMLYRLYKVSEIPKDEEALTKWLYDRFIEKNTLLDNFYKYGSFYLDRNINSTVIQQDVLRFALINLFFITSTYFHYQMFCTLYSYCVVFAEISL